MSKLGDAKTLGGIGAILLLIPGISIVGYILILIATKYVSDELGDKSIFDNMLYAVIAGIVGVAAAAFIIFTGAAFSAITFTGSAIAGVIVGLAVAWIALIISSIFIRRAYNTMATKLNVGTFRTAGTLYFVGAILTIILVGLIVLLVAAILQIIAFFGIPDSVPGMQAPPMGGMAPQPMGSTAAQAGTKFCPNCGTQLAATATYCTKCGARL
ncbi:MAG TPA: DUF996 domain-containing protein [Nitrososphaerales archaeon]|nr:DUF996 domain-containing protein [Nitrososphaerales archaeon]